METFTINRKEYRVKPGEFVLAPHAEYSNLRIYPKVGELERIAGLLSDLTEGLTDSTLYVFNWTHGGFVPIQCTNAYSNVAVYTKEVVEPHESIPAGVIINQKCAIPFAVYVNDNNLNMPFFPQSYILCNGTVTLDESLYTKYALTKSDLFLYVPHAQAADFLERFGYYLTGTATTATTDGVKEFAYDNLIHLCIMVKNAGPIFEQVLTENLSIVDRWTVLDTGSTDGTQDIVRKVFAGKKGTLYEEPFINFRESRNRCLDLAGRSCKYLVMLDDTYVLRNNLRGFLDTIRGDQFATSYSLLIKSDDVEYYSNRVTMSEKALRYIYTIHEVIQDTDNKENVVIPKDAAYVHDHRADYMEKRTMDRKRYDLQLLHDMVRDDPTNPRHYYYLAQTYNLLEEYELAAFWFKKRAFTDLKGHEQEAVDSCFELARIYNFKLNKPWNECKPFYEQAWRMDQSRPDALYFLGIHYHLESDNKVSFGYFKKAFELGYPIHAQFSLKPTLSFHFLPKFLAPLCYEERDWQLGLDVCERFMANNGPEADGYDVIASWHAIYLLMVNIPRIDDLDPYVSEKPIVVFVADGGWGPWTGSDILTKGVGGSETYIIELARWIQASGKYQCYVFCNCEESSEFEGVQYRHLREYVSFIFENSVHTSVVSRYSEYIPVTLEGLVENVYLVLHDLGPTGLVIPVHAKLKKVLCLTDWHVQYFTERFPSLRDRTESFYYGVDTARFKPALKVRHSFIYSSFPNRGLLPLLQMWPKIKATLPDAVLHVYSDIEGAWVNRVAKDQMDAIRWLLANGGLDGVVMHGWVSKDELAAAWSKAHIWLYPCIFQETFCLTAREAAASKTLAVGTPLAALKETIGERGILVTGNPMDEAWQNQAIGELLAVLQDAPRAAALVEANYRWALSGTWKQRGEEFMTRYLDPFGVTVAGMYNWSHDIPVGGNHQRKFEAALAVAQPKRILEIGTYAGTSLIAMLERYPGATAVAIDRWKSYKEEGAIVLYSMERNKIEQIFHQNLARANMTHRVTAMKGDSAVELGELLRRNEFFDFVYVDGSHVCLDCYSDIILGWNLLRCGGVLAVDDVLYHQDKVLAGDLLGYPLKAKEHFMRKFAGKYDIISDSYRLFVRKR